MSRKVLQLVPALALIAVSLVWVAPRVKGQASAMPSTKDGDWPTFTADLNGCKCSPGDQINASNFSKLEIAWRFKTDNLGPRSENKLEGTPLEVRGTVYATAGTRKDVVALDAKTGETEVGVRARRGRRARSGRRASCQDAASRTGPTAAATSASSTRRWAISSSSSTRRPARRSPSFGKDGIVDLKVGVMYGKFNPKTLKYEQTQIDLEQGRDRLALGADRRQRHGARRLVDGRRPRLHAQRQREGPRPRVRRADRPPGVALQHDAGLPASSATRRGKRTRGTGRATRACGRRSAWIRKRGIVYLPVETPTIDEYGGNRPGNNLFAESLVAVDMKTGVRKWHFQMVHHGLWDHDNSSASLLMDVNIDGRPRKVVAQPTKQGWLYVFDRITGEPIWPIEERAVPQSDVPGEKTAKTQPFVTKPPPYSRTFVSTNDIIDFTPALHQQALDNLKNYRWEQSDVRAAGLRSSRAARRARSTSANTSGGVNWPGSSFDPETGIFYTQAGNSGVSRPAATPTRSSRSCRRKARRRWAAADASRSGKTRTDAAVVAAAASRSRRAGGSRGAGGSARRRAAAAPAGGGGRGGGVAAQRRRARQLAARRQTRRAGSAGGGRGGAAGGGGRGGLTAGPERPLDRQAAVRRRRGAST